MPDARSLRSALVVLSLFVPACGFAAGIDTQDFKQIERGRYLAIVGDCGACHTLPDSGALFAGGRPIETPFGTLLAPNITPDTATGIGAWSDDEFINSLTKGRGRNGTHLYPAMPYNYYTKVTHDDALAIRAYLNTVPVVHNSVHSNQLPFPFNIRLSMLAWNKLFFTPGTFRPDPRKSEEWNRGAYLTEGLGHCGACHTPKNLLGGDKASRRFRGYALQGWFAPDITNDRRRGLGGWSVEDVAAYLKTGHTGTAAATGLMAETIGNSTSQLSDADLKAIAVYLKDEPGPGNDQNQQTPVASSDAPMKVGAKIYADECAACHGANGKGVSGLFPALDGSAVVQQVDATSLMHVVLRGARTVATDAAPTAAGMPQFGWFLKDDEVAAVLTYIRNAWGNAASSVTAGEVAKARQAFAGRSD
jgi:mono/diheme cytochrome c family protein